MRPNNKGSGLLTREENEALFRQLGPHNYTLASGIVQLLAAEPPRRREWQKKHVGVVCFIKDYAEKGYFLRLYDITRGLMLWEQPFYDGFIVRQKSDVGAPELITFEGDNCVYGLNFSDPGEATNFTQQVNKRFEQEQKQRSRNSTVPQQSSYPQFSMNSTTTSQNIVAPSPVLNFGNGASGGKSKKKKGKITKSDISLPTNFEHRVHVGWDPGQGFQTSAQSREDLDPQIKMLLDKIGMPTNLGKKDRKIVYEIIDQHGGLEAVKNELSHPPPPPPSRSPPQIPTGPYGGDRHAARGERPKARDLPPPPPAMTNTTRQLPQPPAVPPLPPSVNRPGAPPPPPAPPVGNKGTAAPPPPPPPLPSGGGGAAPPPPPPPPPVVGSGGGSNFLAEIAKGVSLKPVQNEGGGMHTSRSSDSRDAMLNDIKEGVDRQERQRVTPPEEMGGIAGAIARALQERRCQVKSDSESEEDASDSGEDEWDD